MGENLIVDHLKVTYGEKLAVDDVSFSLSDGKIYVIVGESGSGKTTLLRTIGGLLKNEGKIVSGEIKLKEQNLAHLSGCSPDKCPIRSVNTYLCKCLRRLSRHDRDRLCSGFLTICPDQINRLFLIFKRTHMNPRTAYRRFHTDRTRSRQCPRTHSPHTIPAWTMTRSAPHSSSSGPCPG